MNEIELDYDAWESIKRKKKKSNMRKSGLLVQDFPN